LKDVTLTVTAKLTGPPEADAAVIEQSWARPERGPAPRGIDPARLPALFPQWDLTSSRPANEITLNRAMRDADPSWYQFVRQ
jgi:hypothetical protein